VNGESSQEDRIRNYAHQHWLNEGKPDGREREHWDLATQSHRKIKVTGLPANYITSPASHLAHRRALSHAVESEFGGLIVF
jgi:hypothetical protein